MANRRRLIKRRKAVRNICKITRTMQLIATARFQKAMNRAQATRPYAAKLADMLEAVRGSQAAIGHPLLEKVSAPREALIVITSNRGLCGGYNASILRLAREELRQRRAAGRVVTIHALGKKGITYLRFLGEELAERRTDIDDRPRFEQVVPLADAMMATYARRELASVSVCYMRFMSASVQRPTIMNLLPLSVEPEGPAAAGESPGRRRTIERLFDFTPPAAELLRELLPAAVRMRLFQCFTDAAVSEQVARMVAMKAATDSAGEMIKILTRQYNRARQTSITMELLDIVGGAAAVS